jgi:hypothetical protein
LPPSWALLGPGPARHAYQCFNLGSNLSPSWLQLGLLDPILAPLGTNSARLVAILAQLCGILLQLGASLAQSWLHLVPTRPHLSPSWPNLAASCFNLAPLGANSAPLVAILAQLCGILLQLWASLAQSWLHLVPTRPHLSPSWPNFAAFCFNSGPSSRNLVQSFPLFRFRVCLRARAPLYPWVCLRTWAPLYPWVCSSLSGASMECRVLMGLGWDSGNGDDSTQGGPKRSP